MNLGQRPAPCVVNELRSLLACYLAQWSMYDILMPIDPPQGDIFYPNMNMNLYYLHPHTLTNADLNPTPPSLYPNITTCMSIGDSSCNLHLFYNTHLATCRLVKDSSCNLRAATATVTAEEFTDMTQPHLHTRRG